MTSDEPLAISVLLVEDYAPTLWRLQDALTKAGYQMRAAATLPAREQGEAVRPLPQGGGIAWGIVDGGGQRASGRSRTSRRRRTI